uniref:Uncharacterized protein n=1 Tax=Arundo donax TaxID=35708 RepID=A0A0A9BXJ3_ARUDO
MARTSIWVARTSIPIAGSSIWAERSSVLAFVLCLHRVRVHCGESLRPSENIWACLLGAGACQRLLLL